MCIFQNFDSKKGEIMTKRIVVLYNKSKDVIVDNRSKRAIAIDRAKRAKVTYKEYNQKYAVAPNKSDLEGYDDKKIIEPPKSKTKTKQKKKEKKTLKLPPKEVLLKYFNKMDLITRFKDLTETRRLVKTKKEFEIWKKNPYAYDIEGIDTAPEDVYIKKIEVLQEKTGIKEFLPKSRAKGASNKRVLGFYEPYSHKIYLKKPIITAFKHKKLTSDSIHMDIPYPVAHVVAHELGHAYHYAVIEGAKTPKERLKKSLELHRNVYSLYRKNAFLKTPKQLPSSIETELSFKSQTQLEKLSELAVGIKDAKNTPFGYLMYVHKHPEYMANLFATMVINRKRAKKKAPIFYRAYKKAFKSHFKSFKKAEFEAVAFKFSKKEQQKLKKMLGF